MRDRELMQHVLETMQHARVFIASREKIKQPEGSDLYDAAIDLLLARLRAPEPEPVAWYVRFDSGRADLSSIPISDSRRAMWESAGKRFTVTPLYTAPPQREFIGLTDEEMADAWAQSKGDVLLRLKPFARAIEAKLKEKNNGI